MRAIFSSPACLLDRARQRGPQERQRAAKLRVGHGAELVRHGARKGAGGRQVHRLAVDAAGGHLVHAHARVGRVSPRARGGIRGDGLQVVPGPAHVCEPARVGKRLAVKRADFDKQAVLGGAAGGLKKGAAERAAPPVLLLRVPLTVLYPNTNL